MDLNFQDPPRTRDNDLVPYEAIIVGLASAPGRFALVATDVSASDQDKIVRTFKQREVEGGELLTVTRQHAPESETRDVYVKFVPSDDDAKVESDVEIPEIPEG